VVLYPNFAQVFANEWLFHQLQEKDMNAAGQGQGVSIKPSDAVAGGSMIDDADVKIASARWYLYDYNGKVANPVLAIGVDYVDPKSGESLSSRQYYSAGEQSTKNFVPSADGRMAMPVGTAAGLSEGSNALLWITSLINSGFPEDKVTNDIGVFDNTVGHVNQVPQPKRQGMSGDGNKTILILTKIHTLPWQQAAGPAPIGKGAAAGKKAAQANQAAAPAAVQQAQDTAAAVSGDVQQKATDTVMSILINKGGVVPKAALAQEAFKLLAKEPDRNLIVQLVFKDEFLSAPGQPWSFDGTTVTM
jgi:hypothetical protein